LVFDGESIPECGDAQETSGVSNGPAKLIPDPLVSVRVLLEGVAALAEFATRLDDLLTLTISDPNPAATIKSTKRIKRCLRRDVK